MDAVQKANAGHPGTAMALAPLAYLLYRDVMRHNPADPALARPRPVRPLGRARLHPPVRGAAPRRATTSRSTTCSSSGSGARGRRAIPSTGTPPGIETTTGPLGQGFANGVGMAIAQRFLAERYNRPAPRDRRLVDLRDLLRRRHDGGRHAGGGVDRRPPRARPARLRLRRQPHHDRRHDVALVHDRGQGQALRGVRLARPARRRLRGPRRAAAARSRPRRPRRSDRR